MQPYTFPFLKEKNRLIATAGAIYPSSFVAQVFKANDKCFESLLKYFNKIREDGVFNSKFRALFDSFYQDIVEKVKPDFYQLGFYVNHLQSCIRDLDPELLKPRLDRFREDLMKGKHFEDYRILKKFLDDQEDHLIRQFRIQAPEGYTISGYDAREALKEVPFILQNGVYFYGLQNNFPVLFGRKTVSVQSFCERTNKLTLDVLADPASTIRKLPIAVSLKSPSLDLDRFVEAIG